MNRSLASRRYVDLLRQLIAEEGSQNRVAQRLGINQTGISKLLSGDRTEVRTDRLAHVAAKLKLDMAYFHASPDVESVDYHAFLGRPGAAADRHRKSTPAPPEPHVDTSDADPVDLPLVEQVVLDMDLSEEVADELRGTQWSAGDLTYRALVKRATEIRGRLSGKLLEKSEPERVDLPQGMMRRRRTKKSADR